ncbi:MAG: DUF6502 family protein [Bdellovibrio bacteriovorus]
MRALTRLLRPLVRLLIREGVTFPALSALLKGLYVSVGESDFRPADGRQTDSRISLLTGVHRKDVRRLRAGDDNTESAPAPAAVSLSAQVIALWAGSPDFSDGSGVPRPLPRFADDGPSFESLVTRVSKDIRPRAVLDDWLDRGLAHYDAQGRVVLREAALVPREDLEQLAFFVGRNLHDHIAACVHNLAGGPRPFIERAVYYDRLTPEAVARLGSLAHDLGMMALLSLNREASALAQEQEGAPDANHRMSFGVYYYAEPQTPPEEH